MLIGESFISELKIAPAVTIGLKWIFEPAVCRHACGENGTFYPYVTRMSEGSNVLFSF